MTTKRRLAANRLIDSVWTVDFTDHGDGTATLHRYSRDIAEGYEQEHDLPKARLNEDDNRTVEEIVLAKTRGEDPFGFTPVKVLKVRNPEHVFDYGA